MNYKPLKQEVSVMINVSSIDEDNGTIDKINEFLKDKVQPLNKTAFISINAGTLPPNWYGGNDAFLSRVYIGAFNYLNIEELFDFVKTLPLEYPENFQIFYAGLEDGRFTCLEIESLRK